MTAPTLKPKPQIVYPRPPLVCDHSSLFVEPAYEDGQPYTDQDDEDEDTGP